MEEDMRVTISEYENNNRRAVIYVNGEDFEADLFQDGKFVECRNLAGKSIYYAEEVSENWVFGIIK